VKQKSCKVRYGSLQTKLAVNEERHYLYVQHVRAVHRLQAASRAANENASVFLDWLAKELPKLEKLRSFLSHRLEQYNHEKRKSVEWKHFKVRRRNLPFPLCVLTYC